MGCVGGFYKNYDKCLYYLKQYKGVIKKNNYIYMSPKEKLIAQTNANYYKKQLNTTLQKMNKDVKYKDQSKQLRELNEIYQNYLSLESERNKTAFIENNNNNINNNKNIIESNEDIYDNLNHAVKYLI